MSGVPQKSLEKFAGPKFSLNVSGIPQKFLEFCHVHHAHSTELLFAAAAALRNHRVDHRLIGRDRHQGATQQAQAIPDVRDRHREGEEGDDIHQEDVNHDVVEVVVTSEPNIFMGYTI